jgi:hypothetical protein
MFHARIGLRHRNVHAPSERRLATPDDAISAPPVLPMLEFWHRGPEFALDQKRRTRFSDFAVISDGDMSTSSHFAPIISWQSVLDAGNDPKAYQRLLDNMLAGPGASEAFRSLIKARMDRDQLELSLYNILLNAKTEDHRNLFGMKNRTARRFPASVKSFAAKIEAMNTGTLFYELELYARRSRKRAWLKLKEDLNVKKAVYRLPALLRAYAEFLVLAIERRRRGNPLEALIVDLMAKVRASTKRPHYAQVLILLDSLRLIQQSEGFFSDPMKNLPKGASSRLKWPESERTLADWWNEARKNPRPLFVAGDRARVAKKTNPGDHRLSRARSLK